MSTELSLSTSKKAKAFKLSEMTCADLADALEQPPSGVAREPAKLRWLRKKFDSAWLIQCLRVCGKASALHWRSKLRSAALIVNAPAVKLTIGSGIPTTIGAVSYTRNAARMAREAGIHLHNLKGHAFTVLKSTPPPPAKRYAR